jgi:RHS repeat-associated protein
MKPSFWKRIFFLGSFGMIFFSMVFVAHAEPAPEAQVTPDAAGTAVESTETAPVLKDASPSESSNSSDAEESSVPTETPTQPTDDGLATGGDVALGGVLPYANTTTINVDLYSGSSSTRVPITVPEGRANIQPNLAIEYNSSAANGLFGDGWNIDLGSMERSTKNGIPKYDGSDAFVFRQAGAVREIVSVGGSIYRERIEESFLRFEFTNNTWIVTDKAGTQFSFGTTGDAKLEKDGKTFAWYLDRIQDVHGNYLTISYTSFGDHTRVYPSRVEYTGFTSPHLDPFAAVQFGYEDRQDLTSNAIAGFEVQTRKRMNEIRIQMFTPGSGWKDQERMVFTYNYSGATKKSLLNKMTVYGRDGQSTLPSTEFTYQNEAGDRNPTYIRTDHDQAISGGNLWNYRCGGGYDRGHDNFGAVPPYKMDVEWGPTYTEADGSTSCSSWHTNTNNGDTHHNFNKDTANWMWTYLYVDAPTTVHVSYSCDGNDGTWINGNYDTNAHSDWSLKAGWNTAEITFYHQHDNSCFDLTGGPAGQVKMMDSGQAVVPRISGDFDGDGLMDVGQYYSKDGVVEINRSNGSGFDGKQTWLGGLAKKDRILPGDFNADGKTDIVKFTEGGNWYVYRSTGSSFTYERSYEPGASTEKPMTGDVNGDGYTDLLSTFGSSPLYLHIILNDRGSGFYPAPGSNPQVGELGDVVFAAEFNGDGLADLGTFNPTNGTWTVRLNTGKVPYEFETSFRGGFPANVSLMVVDVNSDRLTDMGYYDKSNGNVRYVPNQQSGRGFGSETSLPFSYPTDRATLQVQGGDVNGDGLTDFISSNGVGDLRLERSSGGVVPDLMSSSSNGIGGKTTIAYTTSADRSIVTEPTYLPFTIPVVKSTTVDTGRSETYTTNYRYRLGMYKPTKREFRGFGSVKVIQPGGASTVTTYIQEDDNLKGRSDLDEQFDRSGNLLIRKDNFWIIRYEILPQVNQVYLEDVKITERDEFGQTRCSQETYSMDEYGNLNSITEYGELRCESWSEPDNDQRVVKMTYQNDPNRWILGLLTQTVVRTGGGNIERQSWLTYDDGRPLTKGLLTQREEWNNAPQGDAANPKTHYEYDEYGNLRFVTDPLGNETKTAYDTVVHVFPTKEINARDQFTETEYYGVNGSVEPGFDGGFGQIKTITDLNQNKTRRSYDTFGRLIKEVGPLDSSVFPTVTREYTFGSDHIRVITRQRIEHGKDGTFDQIEFSDALGRLIMRKKPAEKSGQWGVFDEVTYNEQGQVGKKYLPRWVEDAFETISPKDPSVGFATLYYDDLGRVRETVHPDGSSKRTDYRIEDATDGPRELYKDWVMAVIDENDHKNEAVMDDFQNMIERREFTGTEGSGFTRYATTLYTYTLSGQLKTITDAEENVTTVDYDTLGRKTRIDDPDTGVTEYAYDLAGNPDTKRDAEGQTLDFTVDELNRITKKVDDAGKVDVQYAYDNPSDENAKGRLSSASYISPVGHTDFTYDALGRETGAVKLIDDTSYTIERSYDALNRLTRLVYPDGSEAHYAYNRGGDIESVVNAQAKEIEGWQKIHLSCDGFNGSKVFIDSTGRHTVTGNGDAHIDQSACVFDGDGDYLSVPDSSDWDFGTDDFTIEFLLNPTNFSTPQCVWCQAQDSSNFVQVYYNESKALGMGFYSHGEYIFSYLTHGDVLKSGEWQVVKIERRGRDFTISIDGTDQEFAPGGIPIEATILPDLDAEAVVGNRLIAGQLTEQMNGRIDEFKITRKTSTVLEDPDVALHLAANGEEGSKEFLDSTAQHAVTAVGDTHIDTTQKMEGTGSARLDGDEDYLTLSDSPDWAFGGEDFVVNFWLKTSVSGFQPILSQGSPSNPSFRISIDSSNLLSFISQNERKTVTHYTTASVPAIFDDVWHYIEFERQGESFFISVDGESQDLNPRTPIETSSLPDGTTDLYIGSDFNRLDQFSGSLDDVRIILPSRPSVDPIQRLLITGDGPDGSQDIIDETGRHPITVVGDTQIDSQSFAGSGSVRFDGSGDYLEMSDHDDWNFSTKDFEFDFYVRFDELTTYAPIYNQRVDDQNYVYLYKNNIHGINFESMSNGEVVSNFYTDRNTVTVDRWYHIEVGTVGGEEFIRIDGDVQRLNYDSPGNNPDGETVYPDLASPVQIGWDRRQSYFNGWLDEFSLAVKEKHLLEAPKTLPITHYGFEELSGRTFYDDINWNNATLFAGRGNINDLVVFDGVKGNAIRMDTTGDDDDVLDVDPLGSAVSSATRGTVSFWVRDPQQGIVFSDSKGETDHLLFGADASQVNFSVKGTYHGTNQDVLQASWRQDNYFADEEWHHVAWVQDGERIKLYVDGAEKNLTMDVAVDPGAWFGTIEQPSFHAMIGARVGWQESYDSLYIGDLDEFHVFGMPLTAEEIAQTYDSARERPDVWNPFSHYKLNETTGTTVNDDGPEEYDGTAGTDIENLAVPGRIGGAFRFNGVDVNNNVNLYSLGSAIGEDILGSFAFWVKDVGKTLPIYSVFSLTNDSNKDHLEVFVGASRVRLEVWHSEGSELVLSESWAKSNYFTSGWHHIAFVQTGTGLKLYVDGNEKELESQASEIPGAWFNTLRGTFRAARLGQRIRFDGNTDYLYQGHLDDFRYYQNRLLTMSDVQTLYNGGRGTEEELPAPPEPPQPTRYIDDVNYNPAGQITKVVYGNGTQSYYRYHQQTLRLEQMKSFKPGTNPQEDNGWAQADGDLQDFTYAYDPAGNMLSIDDKVNTADQTFRYDEQNRLVHADAPATYRSKDFEYDTIGNLMEKDGKAYVYGENGAGPHAVTTIGNGEYTFTYDANGNMETQVKGGVTTRYVYDVENRLIEIQENGVTTATYAYDGDGTRTTKVVQTQQQNLGSGRHLLPGPRLAKLTGDSSETTRYVGDVYEENGTQKTTHVFFGSTRFASVIRTNAGPLDLIYILPDHLGSTNLVTNEEGEVIELSEYQPFGEYSEHDTGGKDDATNVYFTGQERDAESGLYYYGGRYYNPAVARFTTADPFVQFPENPQSLNRYAYAGNNPVNITDPTGYSWWGDFFRGLFSFFNFWDSEVRVPIPGTPIYIGYNWGNGTASVGIIGTQTKLSYDVGDKNWTLVIVDPNVFTAHYYQETGNADVSMGSPGGVFSAHVEYVHDTQSVRGNVSVRGGGFTANFAYDGDTSEYSLMIAKNDKNGQPGYPRFSVSGQGGDVHAELALNNHQRFTFDADSENNAYTLAYENTNTTGLPWFAPKSASLTVADGKFSGNYKSANGLALGLPFSNETPLQMQANGMVLLNSLATYVDNATHVYRKDTMMGKWERSGKLIVL